MKRKKQKGRIFLVIATALIMYQPDSYAQDLSPADQHYMEHLAGELPSETYYNENILRAGPPGGPGGEEEGENGGVGTDLPLGNGTSSLIVTIMGYGFILTYKRYRKNKLID